MTCPSCGYPEQNRIGEWCPVCVAYPELRDDGSRPWAELPNPVPFEQEEIDKHNRIMNELAGHEEDASA